MACAINVPCAFGTVLTTSEMNLLSAATCAPVVCRQQVGQGGFSSKGEVSGRHGVAWLAVGCCCCLQVEPTHPLPVQPTSRPPSTHLLANALHFVAEVEDVENGGGVWDGVHDGASRGDNIVPAIHIDQRLFIEKGQSGARGWG